MIPLVDRESLGDRLTRQRRLPIDEAVRIAKEVASRLRLAGFGGEGRPVRRPEDESLTTMRSVLRFLVFTYALSWVAWLVAMVVLPRAAPQPAGVPALRSILYLLGVFAPSLVALALTARTDGAAGVRSLLSRTLEWRVRVRWYVFAVSYMAAIKLGAALLIRIATGAWPAFGPEPLYLMALAIPFSTVVQAGEEIGWRGYALPGLSVRFGLSGGSIVLGMIWALWHLPFFLIPDTDKSGQSFPMYLLSVTALSVAMARLYWQSNRSLLLTMLMHAAINNTKDIVPSGGPVAMNVFSLDSSVVAWLTVALLWVCAAYFLVRMSGVKRPHRP